MSYETEYNQLMVRVASNIEFFATVIMSCENQIQHLAKGRPPYNGVCTLTPAIQSEIDSYRATIAKLASVVRPFDSTKPGWQQTFAVKNVLANSC